MIGIILAGGDSLRMGKDKATLQTPDGWTMAELAFSKLASIGLTSYLSINQRQSKDPQFYKKMPFLTDNPAICATGPLLGLLTAHQAFPKDDIFLLGCHMPLLKTMYLDRLFDKWLEQISEVYVYQRGGRAEPFCGIYTHQGLEKINRQVESNPQKADSLQYFIQGLNTCYMPIEMEELDSFTNINWPEEFNRLFTMYVLE